MNSKGAKMRTVVDFSKQVWKLEDSESNEWE